MNSNSILPDQNKYLQMLVGIVDNTESLYFSGNLPDNRVKTVSIIGTRKPTDYGREFAYRFSYELAKQRVVIVSGLAYGIDSIAHQAAIDAGGITIAILPAGLDKIYPTGNTALANKILQSGGCLISQFEPGTHPYKSSFVKRSVIVSGLADGVLVIEAGSKSGTIHTAGFTTRQGRVLMALPGNINSPMSQGCNDLIKAGATAVTETADILKAINFEHQLSLQLDTPKNPILQILRKGAKSTQELQQISKMLPAELSKQLTDLEISGQIKLLGGRWSI